MDAARLRDDIARAQPHLVDFRHDLHQHPELAYQERRTAERIAQELSRLNIPHVTGLAGGTGVLAHLPATSSTPGPAVALRADIDALPILERTGKPYASKTPGLMHACGHDGHTAILLGAAAVLSRTTHRPRPVTFLFQPAEEGGGGADKLCKQGALSGSVIGPPIKLVFGLHCWPTLPLGTLGSKPGPILASTDNFYTTILGTQAHGAYPHYSADPILTAAHIISMLQSIASRNVGPLDSVVLSVGEIHAGTATNIIPESCSFSGTVRTLLPETRALAKERFHSIVNSAAAAMRCRADIRWEPGYPVTFNDPAATDQFFSVARAAFGESRVVTIPNATMGGEDFSYYGQHAPACFFMLGLKPDNAADYPTLHQPDFDFNDDAIPTGVEAFCQLALSEH